MKRLLWLGCASLAFITASAQARVTRIEITKHEPFAAGQIFGAAGANSPIAATRAFCPVSTTPLVATTPRRRSMPAMAS
jgi:hypothetical protein